jgi:hypothetical protein
MKIGRKWTGNTIRVLGACVFIAAGQTAHAQAGRMAMHYWPSDGSTADVLGDAPGTLLNGATFGPGLLREGLSLNQSSVTEAAVDFGTSAGNVGAADFVLSFAILTTQQGISDVLSKRVICNRGSHWDVRLYDGKFVVTLDEGSANYTWWVSSTPVNDGSWHVVMLVRSGATNRLFVDGVLDSTVISPVGAPGNIANGAHLFAGTGPCVYADGTQPFVGALDEIQLLSGQ